MKGLENRTAVLDAPGVVEPTDRALTVTDSTVDPEAEVDVLRIDTNVATLESLSMQLRHDLTTANDLLTRYIAVEAWATTLESHGGVLSPDLQIGTELILTMATQDSGLSTSDVVPTMEALSDSGAASGGLRAYAQKLLDGLIRLGRKIAELFGKIYDLLTSRCRASRLKIAAIRTKMSIVKGGRSSNAKIPMGRYSQVLVIRGIPLNTGGELYGSLNAISELVSAGVNSHLRALQWVGDELIKIVGSPSFPNPKATEARITRSFAELEKSALASLCSRSVGSDTRFTNKSMLTTASENLLGNRTLYFTRPRRDHAIADTFGTSNYELTQSRIGDQDYESRAGAAIETLDFGAAGRLLELCVKQIDLIENFESGDPAKTLVATLKRLHNATQQRAKDGGLDSTTSELLYSASVAFSAAASSPIHALISHLAVAVDASLDIIDRSLVTYD